ncbi:MAG TPA: hypothetical protein VFX30_05345 [bacterium]|nr:hypothetical protein [bacterium]
MGPRSIRSLAVFLTLFCLPWGAQAITKTGNVWWGFGRPVKQIFQTAPATKTSVPPIKGIENTLTLDPTNPGVTAEGIQTVTAEVYQFMGSTQTYTGKVTAFETINPALAASAFCTATFTVDENTASPKAFRATISLDPRYPKGEEIDDIKMLTYMESHVFHLNLLCRQLQTAFLNDQKVSVTGIVEAVGDPAQNTMGSIRVIKLASTPDGASPVENLPASSLCVEGVDCIADGTPQQFEVEAGRFDSFAPFCRTVFKVNQGGTDQKLTITISYDDYQGISSDRLLGMQAKDTMCEAVLKAMSTGKVIGVVGRGIRDNMNANRISSPRWIQVVPLPPLF